MKVFEAPPVKLEQSGRRGRVKKEKFTVSSLPFPPGSANVQFTQRWRKVFKSSLIFWASCQDDPFGTNALLDTVVENLWNRVFPSLASAYDEHRAAICQVVSSIIFIVIWLTLLTGKAGDVLINWRSSMGKEGIVIVTKALRADEISDDDAPAAADFLLEEFSFFYENPKSTVSLKFFDYIYSLIILTVIILPLSLTARQGRVSRQSRCVSTRSAHQKDYWIWLEGIWCWLPYWRSCCCSRSGMLFSHGYLDHDSPMIMARGAVGWAWSGTYKS